MRAQQRRLFFATAVLCITGLPLFADYISSAQTTDPARAARIRNQIVDTSNRPVTEAEIKLLRSDLNKAMEALVARIDTLEKDMVDLKSRILVLEARKASGDTKDRISPKSEPSQ